MEGREFVQMEMGEMNSNIFTRSESASLSIIAQSIHIFS